MRRRTAHAAFAVVAAVCGAVAVWNGVQLNRANRINEAIASAASEPDTRSADPDTGSKTGQPSTPATGAPAASTPGASRPAASTPSASTPSASTPGASAHGASAPAASAPAAGAPVPSAPAASTGTAINAGNSNLSSVPQAQLAKALTLARAGKFNAAVKAYKALLDAPDDVRLPALYDLGNLNMREALKNGQGEAQRALPLIELAKQSYRDALRANPSDWDARYNLERALWIAPEYDDPILQRNQAPVHAEQSTSTVQGAKIDLP